MAQAYGVVTGESGFAARHTIYIGPDGKVLFVDRKVKPGTAGEDVVARLESLGVTP